MSAEGVAFGDGDESFGVLKSAAGDLVRLARVDVAAAPARVAQEAADGREARKRTQGATTARCGHAGRRTASTAWAWRSAQPCCITYFKI